MRTRHISLLLGSVLGIWACGASDGDDPEDLASLTEDIAKGKPGAVNGSYNYCSNPAAPCVQGEGHCGANQCSGGTVCGRDNGPKFGFTPGSDVCVPATCGNRVKDGTETQVDCGGLCGSICPIPVCPPNPNPSPAHCTMDCPCPAGEGDCTANNQCQTGLVCAATGAKYNMPSWYFACTPVSCTNGLLDAPNETGIDCGGTCGACPPTTTFTPLGDLPGGIFYSEANAVSNEGFAVVGNSTSSNGTEAFVWTKANGLVGLGDLPGGAGAAPFRSIAYAVNAGASVVVGTGRSANGVEAFRWTQAGGMVGLGDLAGGGFKSEGWGANSNGSVVIGPSAGPTGEAASRWTGGAWVALPALADATSSRAYASSASGDAVVGRSVSPTGTQAFRWTATTGTTGLGDFSGGTVASVALGLTGTGGSVVGYGTDAAGTKAFRWSTSTGMVMLPLPPGTTTSFAQGISNDGTVVVGTATGAGNVAFIWRSTTNTSVPISTVLGAALPAGWTLETAVGISYDGKHVVGTGTNPSGETEAWLAQIAP